MPQQTIGPSYGDAFLAGLAAGILQRDDLSYWVRPGAVIRPQAVGSGVYHEMYRHYLRLYEETRGTVHFLSGVGGG